MAEIFISYRAVRRPAVEYLTRVLENYGYSVWFDYGLLSGTAFAPQLERELRAARAVIVLWCTMSVESRWVLEEADLASELGILLPTRIEATSLPIGFRRYDTINLSNWDGNPRSGAELTRLLDQIGLKVGRDPVPNYRALNDQEAQWRVHRHGLAAFPIEEGAARVESLRASQQPETLSTPPSDQMSPPIQKANRDPPVLAAIEDVPNWRRWLRQNRRLISGVAASALMLAGIVTITLRVNSPPMVNISSTSQQTSAVASVTRVLVKLVKTLKVSTRTSEEIIGIGFLSDADIIFTISRNRDITALHSNSSLKYWDTSTGRMLSSITDFPGMITNAALSPTDDRILTVESSGPATVWKSVVEGRSLTLPNVECAAFSADGTRIIAGYNDGSTKVLDATSGRILLNFGGSSGAWRSGGSITSVALSLDGTRIVATSNTDKVIVWDSANGHIKAKFDGYPDRGEESAEYDDGYVAKFSPDGTRVITKEGDGTARIWDVNTGRLLLTISGHNDYINTANYSPDGSLIVTASRDNAKIWDAASGQLLGTLPTQNVRDAAFSTHGDYLVTASGDGTARIWTITPVH